MKATEELKNEHQGIEVMLKVLQSVSERLLAGGPVELEHVDGMMEFFTVFVDKCHHGKEEEFLFPALEGVGIPREGGPIGVMLHEHVKGRELVGQMKNALDQLKMEDPKGRIGFPQVAKEYWELLRQHIDKENNVLFALADAKLDASMDAKLMESFERLESERIGPGKHEEFHDLLNKLEAVYLR